METLEQMITRHEGYRPMPYIDTAGLITIGIGFCLSSTGLAPEEISFIFQNRLRIAKYGLSKNLPWFGNLSMNRQNALIDMCYNMGIGTLLNFKNMLAAMASGDFETAYIEALNSHWRTQVGQRAVELAIMIQRG